MFVQNKEDVWLHEKPLEEDRLAFVYSYFHKFLIFLPTLVASFQARHTTIIRRVFKDLYSMVRYPSAFLAVEFSIHKEILTEEIGFVFHHRLRFLRVKKMMNTTTGSVSQCSLCPTSSV